MINSISKTFLPHAIMDLSNQSLPSSKGVPMYLSDYLMLAILGASFLFPSDARTHTVWVFCLIYVFIRIKHRK